MLIKLMKHEFRATGRIMLPLYLVLLVTAVGANFTTRGLLSTQYKLLDVLGALLVMAFVVAIMGVCVMSMVVMVQRFYKNLLGDEGYVMMTLPVSVHQQIFFPFCRRFPRLCGCSRAGVSRFTALRFCRTVHPRFRSPAFAGLLFGVGVIGAG